MARATHAQLVRELLRSPEPSIRWRTRVRVLGEKRTSAPVRALEKEVQRSPRVEGILSHRNAPYQPGTNRSVYHYWQGLHWALASLADLGYPRGDLSLGPLRDRVVDAWLRPRYYRTAVVRGGRWPPFEKGVRVVRGRARQCASIQGNALYSLSRLGILDERSKDLAKLLLRWQWPDGGWNCDRDPSADTSSFMETLTPMLGLWAYGQESGDRAAERAAHRAAEVFLERRLFRRRSDGKVMRANFVQLHYPLYWHYDVLGGLKAMAMLGELRDPRCREALDWLAERELPAGGWAMDDRYFRVSPTFSTHGEFVDWGAPGRPPRNDWVTTDALYVLSEAGRL